MYFKNYITLKQACRSAVLKKEKYTSVLLAVSHTTMAKVDRLTGGFLQILCKSFP